MIPGPVKKNTGLRLRRNMIRHTNRLALQIHQAAKAREVETFKDWALERLRSLVPFRHAIWVSVPVDFDSEIPYYSVGGDNRTTLAAVRFSGPILPMIAAQAERYAGETVQVSWEREDGERGLPDNRPRLSEALATHVSDHGVVAAALLVIFRTEGDPPFAEEERAIVEMVAPHMVEAFRTVLLKHLAARGINARGDRHASVVTDARGTIHEGNPQFVELLQTQWAGWNGPVLPDELRDFGADGGAGCCGTVCYQTHPINDELWLVEVWERGLVDVLTPSERRVAALLAEGHTYKEAASQLGIAVSTITNHANRIYEKLNIRNKAQLAQVVAQSREG